jgi:hypothetical protein
MVEFVCVCVRACVRALFDMYMYRRPECERCGVTRSAQDEKPRSQEGAKSAFRINRVESNREKKAAS